MPNLITAFKQMRRRGLLARLECYCEHCGQEKILKAAQRRSRKQRAIRGFVHVGEWIPPSPEELRVPIRFGSLSRDTVAYHGPDSLPVGRIVAECLDKEGIRYDWDQRPGSPILVHADSSLSGIPASGSHHVTHLSEDHQTFRSPRYPDSLLDSVPGNPVRLLNVARAGRRYRDLPHLHGRVPCPQVGDHIKLGFVVRDAVAPEADEDLAEMIDRVQLESMWVEVTAVLGKYPQCVYRGELLNAPVFLDTARLQIGSSVNFTPDHVYPLGTQPR